MTCGLLLVLGCDGAPEPLEPAPSGQPTAQASGQAAPTGQPAPGAEDPWASAARDPASVPPRPDPAATPPADQSVPRPPAIVYPSPSPPVPPPAPAPAAPAVRAAPLVRLSAGVALPQTGPNGRMVGFSVDYQFTEGGPDSGSKYAWVILRARGEPGVTAVPLQARGTLQTFIEGWRPEEGPFQCQLVEVRADGLRRPISTAAPLETTGQW